MELLNRSIILMVPFLFPAVPKDVSLSCEGVHKNGRSFRVVLYLHEFANAMVCCRMRRLFVEHERDERAFQYLDDAVPSVKLGAILGTGATSIVRVGNLKSNNQIVAMKFVTKNSEELALKEGGVLSRMSHFNIPKMHFLVSTNQHSKIILEFCPGVELGHYIQSKGSVLMSEDEAKHYFSQLVAAVAYLHGGGIVHRDVRLENIIISNNSASDSLRGWKENHLKLIDFGFSCQYQLGAILTTFCGTPAYSSSELVTLTPYCGPEADIWAMGINGPIFDVSWSTSVFERPRSSVARRAACFHSRCFFCVLDFQTFYKGCTEQNNHA
jgi:serine/threonine protein kinase